MTAAPTSARSPKNDSTTMPGLVAAPRTAHGKGGSRQLRKTGQIPAIAYGKGFESTSIAVSPKEILSILKTEKGQNNVIQMKLGGAKPTDLLVMIKDYSYHPVSRELEHVDFVQVKLDQEVMVELPLIFTGKPVGLAEGGIIRQVYRTIPIRCLPNLIPVKVEIDIAHLALGEHIATKDLKLPAGVTVRLPDAQTLIAIVTPEKDRTADEAAAVPGAPGAPAAAGAPGAPAAAGAKDAKGGAAPAADAKAAPAKDAKKK